MSDLTNKQRYGLALASLTAGVVLLVMGGKHQDVATQTAGGTIITAVVAVLGYRGLSKDEPKKKPTPRPRKK